MANSNPKSLGFLQGVVCTFIPCSVIYHFSLYKIRRIYETSTKEMDQNYTNSIKEIERNYNASVLDLKNTYNDSVDVIQKNVG